MLLSYHRLTKANTPASAPLRCFLSFSPWRAPARLWLESQKSLGNPSLAGAKQFCRTEMCPNKEGPAGNTCRISKGHDAVWAHFCPAKPCLPSSIDGTVCDQIRKPTVQNRPRTAHFHAQRLGGITVQSIYPLHKRLCAEKRHAVSIWLICAAPTSVIAASRSCVRFFR